MDKMVDWTVKNRSNGTYRFYKEHAQQFADWLKESDLREITVAQLRCQGSAR